MTSLLTQCGDQIVSVIQALALTGIDNTEIQLRKSYYADSGAQIFKGISVVPVPERESPGTNVRDDWGRGYLITCAQGTGHGSIEDIDKISTWRQSIIRAFNNKRALSTVTECYICTFEPGDMFVPKEYKDNKDVTMFVIRAWCREPRT